MDYPSKQFNFKKDVNEVICENESKAYLKAGASFKLLEIGGINIVLGLSINEEFTKDGISRFIGNYFSRPLFQNKQWFLLVKNESHLFNIQIKEYLG